MAARVNRRSAAPPTEEVADPLALPAFLDRRGEGKLPDAKLQAIINERTAWIMPSAKRREEIEMLTLTVKNPEAPVQVLLKGNKKTTTLDFANLAEFKEWHAKTGEKEATYSNMIDDDSMVVVNMTALDYKGEGAARPPKADKATKREAAKKIKSGEVKVTPPQGAIPDSPKGRKKKSTPKTKAAPAPAEKKGSAGKASAARGGSSPKSKVTVNGKPFNSVADAFRQLRLELPKHVKFRAGLKKAKTGKATYEEKGKKYEFAVVKS